MYDLISSRLHNVSHDREVPRRGEGLRSVGRKVIVQSLRRKIKPEGAARFVIGSMPLVRVSFYARECNSLQIVSISYTIKSEGAGEEDTLGQKGQTPAE